MREVREFDASVLVLLCVVIAVGSPAFGQRVAPVGENTVFVCREVSVTLEAEPGYDTYRWRELGGPNLNGDSSYEFQARTTRTFVVESRLPIGPNLASNATFDEGPSVGYDTEYVLNDSGSALPGTYNNVDDPRTYDPGLTYCRDADRAPTDLKMMIASTAANSSVLLYRQRVRADPGGTYLLSATAIHVSEDPVRLQVVVDGGRETRSLEVKTGPCDTDQFSFDYVAVGPEIVIEIYNATERGGAIFGLDGVVVAKRPPPRFDTVTVAVLGESTERQTPGVCDGRPYVHSGGERVPLGDSLVLSYSNRGGCDSIVVIVPRDLTQPDTATAVTACVDEEISGYGRVGRRDTVLCRTFRSLNGCDSMACVEVAVFSGENIEVRSRDDGCTTTPTGAIRLGAPAAHQPISVGWAGATPVRGDTTRAGLRAGAYRAVVVSAAGCSVQVTPELARSDKLVVSLGDPIGSVGCADLPPRVTLDFEGGGGGPVEFVLTGPSSVLETGRQERTGAPRTVALTGPGPWSVSATDAGGCEASTDIAIASATTWSIEGAARLPADSAAAYSLSGTTAPLGTRVVWFGNDGNAPSPLDLGTDFIWSSEVSSTLRAEVSAEGVCLGAAQLDIAVFTPRFARFPTAFSPNGDGLNDRFAPVPTPDRAQLSELAVYDRWGGHVYTAGACETGSRDCRWAGRTQDENRDATAGTYVYVAVFVLPDGTQLRESGEVTLLR